MEEYRLIIGVYKITNPEGKVYIGQSRNVVRRFQQHKSPNRRGQAKLSESIQKYGIENHTFEVIEECGHNLLNEIELKYQKLFNTVDEGLNDVYVKLTKPKVIECYKPSQEYLKFEAFLRKQKDLGFKYLLFDFNKPTYLVIQTKEFNGKFLSKRDLVNYSKKVFKGIGFIAEFKAIKN